ncbi:hypothetical protein MKQ70_32370 [Chitinophaga sedimenti]|uniref:hypothetical protein n=1 Tax=Chitinophaga sedimenti TaxID=2033606 RepID=UPI002004AE7C|nr:hypothetical protein [Chitinophaga sedimenti]MCK7559413.1 hypothetical protein [Chitinophaga sedimenti]
MRDLSLKNDVSKPYIMEFGCSASHSQNLSDNFISYVRLPFSGIRDALHSLSDINPAYFQRLDIAHADLSLQIREARILDAANLSTLVSGSWSESEKKIIYRLHESPALEADVRLAAIHVLNIKQDDQAPKQNRKRERNLDTQNPGKRRK